MVPDWKSFLRLSVKEEVDKIQRHERTGRPLASDDFVLETRLERILHPQQAGRKKTSTNE
jgi:hypothetical protein